MNKKTKKRIIDSSLKLFEFPDGKNKHFTFILNKNKIVSTGINLGYKTHPESKELGYRFDAIHSEFHAVIRYRGNEKDFSRLTLVNTRLNHLKQLDMSKPCPICQDLIKSLGFRKVYYTDYNGNFVRFK